MRLTREFYTEPGSVFRVRYLREMDSRLLEVRLCLDDGQGELRPTDRRISLPPNHWGAAILELLSNTCSRDRKKVAW
jgi:hypothetical protein